MAGAPDSIVLFPPRWRGERTTLDEARDAGGRAVAMALKESVLLQRLVDSFGPVLDRIGKGLDPVGMAYLKVKLECP